MAIEVNEQQWQGWQDPEYRYLHDAAFHQLVDMVEAAIHRAEYTPSEMRQAALLACLHYEHARMRNTWQPK